MYWRILGIAALCGLGLLLAIVGAWYALGGRLYSVQTDSMRPVFSAGDAVLTRRISTNQAQTGDIISYQDRQNPGLIMTHRVIKVQAKQVITKGDNNPEADLPIAPGQILGQVVATAPHLGAALGWLRRPLGLLVLIYIPSGLLAFGVLHRLGSRSTQYSLRRQKILQISRK